MRKKITCFFISMTFLLNLTVTTFANNTNDTKKIFMDSFQKTTTALNGQLDTLLKNSKLNTVFKNNINQPREIDFRFNLKSGADSFYEDKEESIGNIEMKVNLKYDFANFKLAGKLQFKDVTKNKVEKVEVFLSPNVIGYGFGEEFSYYDTYTATRNVEYINAENISELSKKIETIIVKNIDKGEFISQGNNNYTLKLPTALVNKTIKEIAFEVKNDKEFIESLKTSPYFALYLNSEIIEIIDSFAQSLVDANLKITYDIGINANGLIDKQRIKIFIDEDYYITIFTELAGEEYILEKMKIKLSLSQPGNKEEIVFKTSDDTVSEIKIFNAAIILNSYHANNTLTDIFRFNYSFNEKLKKDNFTFSFVNDSKNSNIPIKIKNLVGSLNFDVETGNVSYTIENGKIDQLGYFGNIIFDMSFKSKGISSDMIKLPKNAIKRE